LRCGRGPCQLQCYPHAVHVCLPLICELSLEVHGNPSHAIAAGPPRDLAAINRHKTRTSPLSGARRRSRGARPRHGAPSGCGSAT
jgi:hypothetical protein